MFKHMAKAYRGMMKFGANAYQGLLGGLAAYGTMRGAVAAGSEIYTAGRGLYMAAGAVAPIAAAAMLAV